MRILQNSIAIILLIGFTRAVPLAKDNEISEKVEKVEAIDDASFRLPKHVIPSHYLIELRPVIEGDFTFTGKSLITLKLTETATNITLHAKDLVIDKTRTLLNDVKNTSNIIKPKGQVYVNETDFFVISFDKLEVLEYTLELYYTGKLHEDLNGFYRSSYINAEGKKVWLATTQFEPTWARRAFPCFDEPSFKAQFEISINHDKRHKAISNMMEKYSEPDNVDYDRKWTHFRPTPVMSTYLIAFVVSDFDYKSSEEGRFAVWSRPNAIHTGKYALEIGTKSLHALDKYTKLAHYDNIDKMDNFAIPQFRAGAMENWGIVTYRESALLFEENVTTTNEKQGIATVISHEFAHQWFGNLVSPLWWDYTWLNEGFANYFQYYITEQIEDNWRLMDQFVIKNLQATAFTADDKEDQHPMNGAIFTPLQISAFFDSISYSKAGCVIRMISQAMTDELFQKGLQAYLSKMSFKSATSDNLFEELVKVAANKDVTKEFMDSWATQRGYPVVTVIRDHKAGTAVISQHRFLTNKKNPPTESWIVPINYAIQSAPSFDDTKPTLWLPKEKDANTTVTGIKKGWMIVNKQQTGYYRVNYDVENWQLIIDDLVSENYTNIHLLNRAQLLDDSFHLAQAGELKDFTVFLKLSTYLKQEVDYIPWYAAFRAFGTLNKALANTEKHELFKLYILRIIEKLEKSVGYVENEKDDHVTKFNRIDAITWACYAGSKNCLAAAQKQLVDHINGTKISADLRSVILCSGIRSADAATWEKTFGYFEKIKDETERKQVLTALGCSSDSKILNAFLAKSIVTGSKISPNEALKSVLVGSPNGINIAFDFIDANLKKIVEINKDQTAVVVQILNEIGTRMTTAAQVDKLKKFIEKNKDMGEDLTKKALASALRNLDWIQKNKPTIEKFLDDQKLVAKTPNKGSNNNSSTVLSSFHLILSVLIASAVFRFI